MKNMILRLAITQRYYLRLALLLMAALVATTPAWGQQDPVVEGELKFVDDVQIPASEAGVITQLAVKEGSLVTEGDVMARIDDREFQSQLKIAEQQARSAKAKFLDEVEEKYARAAADAAEAEVQELTEVNSGKIGNVVTQSEVRRADLEWTRAKLQIEKALKDRELARYDFHTRIAEYEAAKQALDRLNIRAPFSGEVVRLKRRQSEWVNPGDAVLQLVRYDVLKVEGHVGFAPDPERGATDREFYDPRDVDGCEVTVEVVTGRNQTQRAKGRITWVNQAVQYQGDYVFPVQAEIPNTKVDGRWVFMPGQLATMTIHLATRNPSISRRTSTPEN